jgi:hypothetical protein
MGRKSTSNNADLVQPTQYIVLKHKKAKEHPPELWPLPKFDPLPISSPYINSSANLPDDIDAGNPFDLFKLIFTDDIIEELVAHINEYIALHLTKKKNAKQIRL